MFSIAYPDEKRKAGPPSFAIFTSGAPRLTAGALPPGARRRRARTKRCARSPAGTAAPAARRAPPFPPGRRQSRNFRVVGFHGRQRQQAVGLHAGGAAGPRRDRHHRRAVRFGRAQRLPHPRQGFLLHPQHRVDDLGGRGVGREGEVGVRQGFAAGGRRRAEQLRLEVFPAAAAEFLAETDHRRGAGKAGPGQFPGVHVGDLPGVTQDIIPQVAFVLRQAGMPLQAQGQVHRFHRCVAAFLSPGRGARPVFLQSSYFSIISMRFSGPSRRAPCFVQNPQKQPRRFCTADGFVPAPGPRPRFF